MKALSAIPPSVPASAPAGAPSAAARSEGPTARQHSYVSGLAGRLLALMVAVVFSAVALLYVTRMVAVVEYWAHERVAGAYAVVKALEGSQGGAAFDDRILAAAGAEAISIEGDKQTRVLSPTGAFPGGGLVYDNEDTGFFGAARLAVLTLTRLGGDDLVVQGRSPDDRRVSLLVRAKPLRENLVRLSKTFLALSLTVSLAVTLALWFALWRLVIRPVTRLTSNILEFADSDAKHAHVIAPSGRRDEIGRAEKALATMEKTLADELRQRKRLSELGLAVARINHDLRNMLTAAQLISDRLAAIPDPLAQRLAPRLVSTLDRAVAFCQATLAYGAGRERSPSFERVDLRSIILQIVETAEAERPGVVAYSIDVPPKFDVYADREHLMRIVENLARNARQALASAPPSDHAPAIRFAAIRAEGWALIEVSDNGPGFPETLRNGGVFEPFHFSGSTGGSGLGLAIAADLVERNRGTISLAPARADDFYCGARFLIRLQAGESDRGALPPAA